MNLFMGLKCSLVLEHFSSPSISLALGATPKPTKQTNKPAYMKVISRRFLFLAVLPFVGTG